MMSSKTHQNKYKLEDPYVESDLQGKICRWYKDNSKELKEEFGGALCEVKLVSGGSLSFKKFEEQQLPSLSKASKEGLYFKLSDIVMTTKPADFFIADKGFIFCQFWKNKQQEICYYMDIAIAMSIKKTGQKSLKEEHFMQLGQTIDLSKYKVGIKRKQYDR